MATKNKTKETEVSVYDFINSYVQNEEKRADSFQLIGLMKNWSGFEPKMWGPTIVGFGSYHYKYASGHEGDAPMIGFSPRKAEFSLYVFAPTEKSEQLLKDLGKFKMGKSCIYVKNSPRSVFQHWRSFAGSLLRTWRRIMRSLLKGNKWEGEDGEDGYFTFAILHSIFYCLRKAPCTAPLASAGD